MDDILIQEMQKQNAELSRAISEKERQNEKLKDALDNVAMPALKEYKKYETSALVKIAEGAIKKILEILQAG